MDKLDEWRKGYPRLNWAGPPQPSRVHCTPCKATESESDGDWHLALPLSGWDCAAAKDH